MSDEAATDPGFGQGVEDLEQLLRDRFLLGLIGQLQERYRNVGSADVEDAVLTAVERLVKRLRRGPVNDVKGYLAKIAFNELNKHALRHRELPLEARDEHLMPSAETEAMRIAAIDIIKAEIRTWQNAHIREVTLVCVEAMAAGEPLEHTEIAELVSVVLGEEISAGSVGTWKVRGLRKLREFIDNTPDVGGQPASGEEEAS